MTNPQPAHNLNDCSSEEQLELQRLQHQLEQIDQQIHKISNKLENPGFLSTAPAALLEKEKQKLHKLKELRRQVSAHL